MLIVDEGAARDKRVVLVQAVTVEATPGGHGGGHADGVYAGGGHDDNYKDLNNGGDTDCEKGDPDGGFFIPCSLRYSNFLVLQRANDHARRSAFLRWPRAVTDRRRRGTVGTSVRLPHADLGVDFR